MKRSIITMILVGASVCASAADTSPAPQPRRQPYKEVRTKRNQDPAVREALRQKMKQESDAVKRHREMAKAQMEQAQVKGNTNRLHGATNAVFSSPGARSATNAVPKPKR